MPILDSLLTAHRIDPNHVYQLGGQLAPVAIREHMVRGRLLVQSAIRHQIISPPKYDDDSAVSADERASSRKDLLIIGGGIAGMVAALHAAFYGIHVTVIERDARPFLRQVQSSRIIDPTQYDWPSPHWADGTTQLTFIDALRSKRQTILDLEWSGAEAKDLVKGWLDEWDRIRPDFPNLRILHSWEGVACEWPKSPHYHPHFGTWSMDLEYIGLENPQDADLEFLRTEPHRLIEDSPKFQATIDGYSMIIFAVGIGEQCSVEKTLRSPVADAAKPEDDSGFRKITRSMMPPAAGSESHLPDKPKDFVGFQFWDADPYEKPNVGLRDEIIPNIVIAGSGDGALQDFIRITTCVPTAPPDSSHSVRDLALYLFQDKPNVLDELGYALMGPEDQAQRAWIWGSKETDHEPLAMLEETYTEAMDWLFQRSSIKNDLLRRLSECTKTRPNCVTLVHSCHHFGKLYPLNHLLVRIIARYMERGTRPALIQGSPEKTPVLLNGYGVTEVEGNSPHVCRRDPHECHGQMHRVQLKSRKCKRHGIPVRDAVWLENVHALILRLGLRQHQPQFTRLSAPIGRQLLPYHTYEFGKSAFARRLPLP